MNKYLTLKQKGEKWMTEETLFYNKEMACPLCSELFMTTKVRKSKIQIAGQDTDLRPLYKDDQINPTFYHAHVCFHCGFSFTEDFSPYFAPGTKELIRSSVCAQWVKQDYSGERSPSKAIKSFKLALYSGTLKKENPLTLAGLAMRTAWIYRDLHDKQEEKRFLSIAVREYEEAFLTDKGSEKMSDIKILYLLGELNWQLGQFENAVTFFSKVIERQHGSNEKNLLKMARERWRELRELKKQQEISP